MTRLKYASGLVAFLAATSAVAQKCSLSQKCPSSAPCCGQYGDCGVGAFCLGGCDPRMSFSMDACVPAPECVDRSMPMNSLDRIVSIDNYLGDASKADWYSQGKPLLAGGNVILTMQPNTVGTVLSSTVTMWYGNVKAKLKTSRGQGVVTAFILLSDVKDEIDYEFVGTELNIAQTNFYFQGIPNYSHSTNISMPDSVFDNFHTYEIDWTPDQVTWLVDGQVGRTLKRADTWNATDNQFHFPQTPSHVQLSLWPGGASTNEKGTIDWAGGPIDWNSEDIKKYGYDFAVFGEVDIKCWSAQPGQPGSHSKKSYIITDPRATNDTVKESDKDTILASLLATGLDPNIGKDPSASASVSANSIPGGSASGNGLGGSGTGGQGGPGANANCGTDTTTFAQNCGSASTKSEAAPLRLAIQDRASAFAVVVALAGGLLIL